MAEHPPTNPRLLVYDREMHLEGDAFIGASIPVIRGNGPRAGDRMGTATVTGFENGSPILDVRLDGQEAES